MNTNILSISLELQHKLFEPRTEVVLRGMKQHYYSNKYVSFSFFVQHNPKMPCCLIQKVMIESLDHITALQHWKATIYSFQGKAENTKIANFGLLVFSAGSINSGYAITRSLVFT